MALYSVPSQFREKIMEINDFFINDIFRKMGGQFVCAEGYDKYTGEFCADHYRNLILAVSGIDLSNFVSSKECRVVYNKLSEIVADVKSHKWLKHYFQTYPNSRHNFPIDIRNHIENCERDLAERVMPITSCELEFLQTLFQTYSEYHLHLIPVIKG